MAQEERLFGAPSRFYELVHVAVMANANGNVSVVVEARPQGKRQAQTLHVLCAPDQSPGHVVGIVTRMLHHWWMPPKQGGAVLAVMASRLGADGYEVSLR